MFLENEILYGETFQVLFVLTPAVGTTKVLFTSALLNAAQASFS